MVGDCAFAEVGQRVPFLPSWCPRIMQIDLLKLDKAMDRSLEAAADHSLWPEILQGISEATGSFGANIIPTAERLPGLVIATESVGPVLEEYFDDGWHQNDWRLKALPLLVGPGTACDQQYTSDDEFRELGYYRFQAKYGIGRSCMIGFSSEQDLLSLTLHRTLASEFFGEAEVAVLRMMRDRLMAAALLMRSLSAKRVEGMAKAFEMADIAAIFFDRFGKVTTVNERAALLLGDELQVRQGELTSRSRAETAAIRQKMRLVTSEHWLHPTADGGLVRIARVDRPPVLVRIQRLGGNLPDFFANSVGVCLFEDMNRRPVIEPGLLGDVYGLTPTEALIAVQLAEGIDLRSAATASSMGYETARTHLRSIFGKTGTGRQSELVAMLGRLKAAKAL
ncbi:helix-turn-helix transcriptional regulator [Rhizobium sp. KVB221]|uniref:Helix-turn-helix transcriptional regulator n=1 Tax=Rhizobium setariae TaxID=2801340 RepID=A0A936YQ88_9HYPH|nr:helix-turn-helix transcriptional regulator [Rhizobium setariae]MBL0372506.1 helix-turn-helix transcriptional regulator [Rhizobium setariae]